MCWSRLQPLIGLMLIFSIAIAYSTNRRRFARAWWRGAWGCGFLFAPCWC